MRTRATVGKAITHIQPCRMPTLAKAVERIERPSRFFGTNSNQSYAGHFAVGTDDIADFAGFKTK